MSELNHPISRLVARVVEGLHLLCCHVSEESSDGRLQIVVEPSAGDYGIICGAGGKVVNALSHVVARAGEECDTTARLVMRQNVVPEPVRSEHGVPGETGPDEIERLIRDAVGLVDGDSSLRIERNNGVIEAFISNGGGLTTAMLHDVFYAIGRRNGQRVKIRVA